MNHLGVLARSYWREWRPVSYGELIDPDAYFTTLGLTAEQQINALEERLWAQDPVPDGESAQQATARRAALGRQAQEVVLADLVYLPPERVPDDAGDQPAQSGEEREFELWQEEMVDQLVAGRMNPEDFTPADLTRVREGLSPRMLELAGLRDEDLRERGLSP